MTEAEYLDLVDRSGRMVRAGKPGYIDADLAPILQRISINPNAWSKTISSFGSSFHAAACIETNLPLISLDNRMCAVATGLSIKVVRQL
jgi:hypothetical protein